ncbi:hypothetical protein HMPREF9120_00895 [Neisseria sp. oral taxon 020 str. F0370]|nr:hypothetical protein HMPREF9120_00895 [Neisseria sp. oral taxon 020 str. F0370]
MGFLLWGGFSGGLWRPSEKGVWKRIRRDCILLRPSERVFRRPQKFGRQNYSKPFYVGSYDSV